MHLVAGLSFNDDGILLEPREGGYRPNMWELPTVDGNKEDLGRTGFEVGRVIAYGWFDFEEPYFISLYGVTGHGDGPGTYIDLDYAIKYVPLMPYMYSWQGAIRKYIREERAISRFYTLPLDRRREITHSFIPFSKFPYDQHEANMIKHVRDLGMYPTLEIAVNE